MSEDDRHNDDAALDRLLAQARWEEPTAAEEYRLREEWVELRRRRRIGPMLYVAAAAAIVIVAGMALLRIPAPVDHLVDVKMLAIQPEPDDSPLIDSRAANSYEMLLMMQAAKVVPSKSVVVADVPPARQPEPQIDPRVLRLVNQLGDPLVKNRYDAARELAHTDPPVVVPILAEMVEQGVNRREALAALMLSRDPLALSVLAEVRTSPTIEAQVIALRTEIH